jgi:hypothetical protein
MVRATLIKGNKILYEYDFLLRKLLNRREAKSKAIYFKTINKLKSGNLKLSLFEKIKRWFVIR